MIPSVPAAHTQNTMDVPASTVGLRAPTKLSIIIPISPSPIRPNILVICYLRASKRYMVLQGTYTVDKYLSVVMAFLFVGIPISFVSPTTGELRDPPFYAMFWVSIGGIVGIFLYDSYKTRNLRKNTRDKRKKPKWD